MAFSGSWQEPGEGQKSGWGDWEAPPTPYDRFMEGEGIPVHRDIGVRTVKEMPLENWERLGGRGSFIQCEGTEGLWGMFVVEVPAGGELKPQQCLYEQVFFVVAGRGSTEVWQRDESRKKVFEWSSGSLFAVPINARHRIVNATREPALLLVGTLAPNIMNVVQDYEFVFNCDYAFTKQFDESDDYFQPRDEIEPDLIRGLAMRRTNLMPDIVECELPRDNRRSPGYRRMEPHMGGDNFYMWIGQHGTGRYSKAHKHASGAVLICIAGQGYTLTWPSKYGTQPWANGHGDKVKRQDYVPGGMVSAAPMDGDWFHQHFGVGNQPLRLTAWFGMSDKRRRGPRPGTVKRDEGSIPLAEGGNAIEYRDEDPYIREEFERMQKEAGGHSDMTEDVYNATFEFVGRGK
jgi:mannose-6-phosphate isomerase-like protein (cupin superfamily)